MIKFTRGISRAAFGLGATVRWMLLSYDFFHHTVWVSTANEHFSFQKSMPRFLSTKVDSFLGGSNAIYVDQMYSAWKQDPKRYFNVHITLLFSLFFLHVLNFTVLYSVHVSWSAYFSSLDAGVDPSSAFTSLPAVSGGVTSAAAPSSKGAQPQVLSDSLGLSYLISAYQVSHIDWHFNSYY